MPCVEECRWRRRNSTSQPASQTYSSSTACPCHGCYFCHTALNSPLPVAFCTHFSLCHTSSVTRGSPARRAASDTTPALNDTRPQPPGKATSVPRGVSTAGLVRRGVSRGGMRAPHGPATKPATHTQESQKLVQTITKKLKTKMIKYLKTNTKKMITGCRQVFNGVGNKGVE